MVVCHQKNLALHPDSLLQVHNERKLELKATEHGVEKLRFQTALPLFPIDFPHPLQGPLML